MTEQLATTDCQSGNSDPSHTLARNESESILHEELARLSEKVRTVIVLCELEGVPQKQVAQQLGIPTSTVNNRIAKLPPTARWDP